MTVAVIAFTRRGAELGRKLAAALGGALYAPARFAADAGAEPVSALAAWTAARWEDSDALVFVGAAGIAVRAVAPHVRDKFTDPAVVSVDEEGRFAVPLLSGHVGGANELASGWRSSPADRRRCPPPPTSTACSPWMCGDRKSTRLNSSH